MKTRSLSKFIVPALFVVALTAGCKSKSKDPVEEGATIITMYLRNFEDWSNEYMNKRVKEFNSNMEDGIQLSVKFFEDEAYTDAFKVAKENGSAPDIFMCSYGNIYHDVVETGDGVPLNDLIKQEYIDDISDNIKPMVTYSDKVYGYPQLSEPSSIFFYRKSMLNAAGVASAPSTWAELLEACSKIKPTLKRGQYCVGIPIGSALSWSTYGLQYNLTGGLALNDDWTQSRVGTEEGFKDIAGLWYDLYGNGYVPNGAISPKGSYNDIIEGMMMGKVAMTFAGSWSIAEIMHTYNDLANDVGVSVIPTKDGDTSKVTASNGGWTYAISSQSDKEHQQKAAKVIEWLFAESPERTAGFFEAAYYSKAAVTNSVKAYISEHVEDNLKEWTNVINDVASKAIPEATYPWSISVAVGTIFETCGLNADLNKGESYKTSTINNAIKTADDSINAIIHSSSWEGKPF